ncbi:ATP-binding protein [Lewinella sp. LCG006]|uniref:hybrid sensor histidine kinase/response regulator transcription factor n=1 Tax=Lewinella sp. LCG006 TaxID=3231911 RepID=UPI0034611CDD
MRRFFLLFISLAYAFQMFGSNISYSFNKQNDTSPNFTDSLGFFVDQKAQYSIEDLLSFPATKFSPLTEDIELSAPVVLWTSVTLTNEGNDELDGYFRLFTFIDSIWMYTIQDGMVINITFSGNNLPPSEKNLSSYNNNLPFSLYRGESKSFFFKMHYNKLSCSNQCLSTVKVIPRKVLDREEIMTNSLQSFYAGIMLFFGLISLFMYSMFWESVFIWFALLMFSFTAYFASLNGLTGLISNYRFEGIARADLAVIVPCILLSATMFISKYTDLRARSIRLYYIYFYYALFLSIVPLIARLISDDWYTIGKISDYLTLILLILTLIIIYSYARKKNKSSIILLVSAGILCLGAMCHILSVADFLPDNLITDYSFQIGTVFFSGILFYGIFDKINTIRAEKERYEELDQVKSRFFANISHEFRTPLTLVMGPIKDVLKNTETKEDRGRLQLAYQNAERLLQLINQLLDLSKLEANKMELLAAEQNLPVILKGIVMSFESLAKRRHIQFNFVAQKEAIPVYIDIDKVEKIFYNLLSNAFKFTQENGEIAVMITDHENHVEILVRDNGVGISSSRLPNIFNRFFQGDNTTTSEHEGTGIGLALVKELVELHKGSIRVESQEGIGTVFTISFKKGTSHLKEHEIQHSSSPMATSTSAAIGRSDQIINRDIYPETQHVILPANTDHQDDDTPVVLIIEDNNAVRDYIKEHLISSFQIVEAINGQKGIDLALELLPDLIISDIMMPEKNGYEVCAMLKKDQRTSHIPIILLTAKAAAEEKMHGLEIGADDYLVKPFDTKELEVRTRNLIASRLLLRKKFSESNTIEPQYAGNNALDKAFIENVCNIVETHLADEQFSVELLAREIGLSRSQLNRKLKALTDLSPNKFIQSFRLQKAKEMLEQGSGNVSEVALETGFNSTAYFIKCFGDKYGQTPGSLL